MLGALGARHILDAVFATDAQFDTDEAHGRRPHAEVQARLARAVAPLLDAEPEAAGAPLLARQMTGTSRMRC